MKVSAKSNFRFSNFAALGLIALSIISPVLNAQDIQTRTITFDKGESSAIIEANITGYEIIDYLLNVKKGQEMKVSLTTDNTANYFNIMEPEEEYVAIFNGSINENSFEGVLERSGDYRIRVYLMRSAARRNETANFRLEIEVGSIVNGDLPEDALVGGTNFNATGKVPCLISRDGQQENCDFGVIRKANLGSEVHIRKPDGRKRIIFFENGEAAGYDRSEADPGELKSSKQGDLYIIRIGEELYKIPGVVIFGG
ncbi:hypothetical protein GCM10023115_38930 [Pontixanthobacter gangjinensis]|uniref:Uncharacterized protein n=1 Tax=Christiangramia aestuarii TaxID=1028746 RepID=A0A7M3SWJ0_9FLAO|nr:hypothetical protein [Christiangramia aestuarii]MUP40971.1 hypothetical protein [Christiangramia aestuarii]